MPQELPAYEEDMNILLSVAKRVQENTSKFDPLESIKGILTNPSEYNDDYHQAVIRLGSSIMITRLVIDVIENIFDPVFTSYSTISLLNLIVEFEQIIAENKR